MHTQTSTPDDRQPHTALMRALRLSPDASLGPRLIVAAKAAAAMHRAEIAGAVRDPHAATSPRWAAADSGRADRRSES